jgi:hypothetical protein
VSLSYLGASFSSSRYEDKVNLSMNLSKKLCWQLSSPFFFSLHLLPHRHATKRGIILRWAVDLRTGRFTVEHSFAISFDTFPGTYVAGRAILYARARSAFFSRTFSLPLLRVLIKSTGAKSVFQHSIDGAPISP